MGKKQKKRSLCFLVMIASIFIMQTMAYSYALEDVSLLANNNILEANSVDENKTIVSVEAFTLGLGYIVMPQYVSFIEGETAGDVLMRFFDNMNGIECDGIQSDGTFHVKKISGQKVRELLAKEIVIPEVLSSYVPNIDINDHSIDSIKNFDFTSQSGWMYCVNNIFPTCGPSSYTLEDGDIIRVQFTLALGADIGGAQAITGGDNFYAVGNKDEITEIIANYILNNENSEIPIPFLKEAEDLTGGMGRESKIVHGSFSPVGSVPELGIVVGWNIKINMDGQYTSQNGRYIYNGFKGNAYMSPRATNAQGDGILSGEIIKKVDGQEKEYRLLHAGEWFPYQLILPENAYVYWAGKSYEYDLFRYTLEEIGNFSYANPNAILLVNNNATYSLQISAPH